MLALQSLPVKKKNPTPSSPTYVIRWSYLKKRTSTRGPKSLWVTHVTVFDSRQRGLIFAMLDSRGALCRPTKLNFTDITRVQLSRFSEMQFEVDELPYQFDAHTTQTKQTHAFMCTTKNDVILWIDLIHSACPRLRQQGIPPPLPPKPVSHVLSQTTLNVLQSSRNRSTTTTIPPQHKSVDDALENNVVDIETLHREAMRDTITPPWQDSRASFPRRPEAQNTVPPPPLPVRPTTITFTPKQVKQWTFEFEHDSCDVADDDNKTVPTHKLTFQHSSNNDSNPENISEELELPIDGNGPQWTLSFTHDDDVHNNDHTHTTAQMKNIPRKTVSELRQRFEQGAQQLAKG